MASNYAVPNNFRELWLNITTNHIKYLCEDKSPVKIKYRDILQNYIKEFLCVTSHRKKFNCSITEEILRRSVQCEEFNALKAASAWLAISTYANNLFLQPWRKEYYEIKLYSGFYKHHIENSLHGADRMLELMGYKHVSDSKMVLDGPINLDRLSSASLDALIAMCECQTLFNIFKELSKHVVPYTWADILHFREIYSGSPEQAIRGLLFSCYPTDYCNADCCPYNFPSHYPSGCRKCHKLVLKPAIARTPVNGYRHQVYYPAANEHYPPVHPAYSRSSLPIAHHGHVPTAKLIDFDEASDSSPYFQKPGSDRYDSRYASETPPSDEDDYPRRSGKESRRSNGLKSWEYVYRGLENRERRESGSSSPSTKTKGNGMSEAFNNLNIGGAGISEPDSKIKDCKDENKLTTWECVTCTFYNSLSKDVCEMCGKSRNMTNEKPLISGGKHCSTCTLVNKKEAAKCEACDANLEGSPTYV